MKFSWYVPQFGQLNWCSSYLCRGPNPCCFIGTNLLALWSQLCNDCMMKITRPVSISSHHISVVNVAWDRMPCLISFWNHHEDPWGGYATCRWYLQIHGIYRNLRILLPFGQENGSKKSEASAAGTEKPLFGRGFIPSRSPRHILMTSRFSEAA